MLDLYVLLNRIDQDDEFWHSSLIVKCLSPRLLQTTNGSLYRLIGKIDREAMHSEGDDHIWRTSGVACVKVQNIPNVSLCTK